MHKISPNLKWTFKLTKVFQQEFYGLNISGYDSELEKVQYKFLLKHNEIRTTKQWKFFYQLLQLQSILFVNKVRWNTHISGGRPSKEGGKNVTVALSNPATECRRSMQRMLNERTNERIGRKVKCILEISLPHWLIKSLHYALHIKLRRQRT